MSNNGLGAGGAGEVARGFKAAPTLTWLDLADNDIRAAGMQHVAGALGGTILEKTIPEKTILEKTILEKTIPETTIPEKTFQTLSPTCWDLLLGGSRLYSVP